MDPYAIIETGGKQFLVRTGDVLEIERLPGEAGASLTLDTVLAVSDGANLKIGTPAVAGASVTAELVDQHRGPKLVTFKKKRRKGYKKTIGHRQNLTKIKIGAIRAG